MAVMVRVAHGGIGNMRKLKAKEIPMLEYNANSMTAYITREIEGSTEKITIKYTDEEKSQYVLYDSLLITKHVDDFLVCPFCGNRDDLSFVDITDDGATAYSVTCNSCNVTMSNSDIYNLISTWNERVYTDLV